MTLQLVGVGLDGVPTMEEARRMRDQQARGHWDQDVREGLEVELGEEVQVGSLVGPEAAQEQEHSQEHRGKHHLVQVPVSSCRT